MLLDHSYSQKKTFFFSALIFVLFFLAYSFQALVALSASVQIQTLFDQIVKAILSEEGEHIKVEQNNDKMVIIFLIYYHLNGCYTESILQSPSLNFSFINSDK